MAVTLSQMQIVKADYSSIRKRHQYLNEMDDKKLFNHKLPDELSTC